MPKSFLLRRSVDEGRNQRDEEDDDEFDSIQQKGEFPFKIFLPLGAT